MGDVLDFTKYRKKINRHDDMDWFHDAGIQDWTRFIPHAKTWKEYTHEEKLNVLIAQKFEMPRYTEYVSKQRYFKQFNNKINIVCYPEWIENMLLDGTIK